MVEDHHGGRRDAHAPGRFFIFTRGLDRGWTYNVKERNLALAAVVAVAVLAACGGGGGGGSAPAPVGLAVGTATPIGAATSAPTAPPGQLVASVSVTLPKGTFAQSVRRAQAIGTGTQSIVFTLLQQNGPAVTGSPQPFGLTASSAGCTVDGNSGNLTCGLLPSMRRSGATSSSHRPTWLPNGAGSLPGRRRDGAHRRDQRLQRANIVLNAQVASVFLVAGNSQLGAVKLQASVARRTGEQGTQYHKLRYNPASRRHRSS